jgi:signal transduction histidine kinase
VGLKILSTTPPDLGEVRETLSEVVDASRRAEEVIRRNHDLFKHRTMQPAPLDINAVILESVILATARLRTSGVRLSTELARGMPAISGDRIEIQQVLLNLIANAIDALEPSPPDTRQIDLSSAQTADGFVQVTVTDNGVGLAAVDLARMFKLSYTTKVSGSGVGLHICRSIVEAHGGRIWAVPAASGGAMVAFALPMEPRSRDRVEPGLGQ